MSSAVTLLVDSKPVSVLCHMGDFGCEDGGWTPVLNIDGRKVHIQKLDFLKYLYIWYL